MSTSTTRVRPPSRHLRLVGVREGNQHPPASQFSCLSSSCILRSHASRHITRSDNTDTSHLLQVPPCSLVSLNFVHRPSSSERRTSCQLRSCLSSPCTPGTKPPFILPNPVPVLQLSSRDLLSPHIPYAAMLHLLDSPLLSGAPSTSVFPVNISCPYHRNNHYRAPISLDFQVLPLQSD